VTNPKTRIRSLSGPSPLNADRQPTANQLRREPRGQVRKALEKSREEIPRRLVHEATVGVELLVHASHDDLRLQERVRVREYKRLA
jgi:hypothetical protein